VSAVLRLPTGRAVDLSLCLLVGLPHSLFGGALVGLRRDLAGEEVGECVGDWREVRRAGNDQRAC
jgi:hypothetical protein